MMGTPEIKIDTDELEDALAGKTPEKEGTEEGKEEDKKTVEEEGKKEVEGEKGPSDLEKLQKQISDLQQLTLEQKKQNAMLESRLKRLSRPQVTKKVVVEEEEEEEEETTSKKTSKKEEKEEVETLEEEVSQIKKENRRIFSMQLDVLSETKKYSDVEDVCSKGNVNDITDAIAKQVAKDEGVDYHQATLMVEKFIWSQDNPYKYLYGLIKEYHPKYRKTSKGQDETTEEGKKEEGKAKEKPKAPKSIAGVSGSDEGKGGWTAAKIDALPEEELTKVPRDIYDKYMKGELD